jgi:hypothetical protein
MAAFEYLLLVPDGNDYIVCEPANLLTGLWRRVPCAHRYATFCQLGTEGWELVAMRGPEFGHPECIFKRLT